MTNPSGPPTSLDSLTVGGVPTMGISGAPLYTGNWWFVNETTGSDGNTGAANSPFKTLSQAQTKATANQNDVVAFQGTIHQTSSLVWGKNQVHLIGMAAPLQTGKRARISVSGSTGFNKLVQVTGSGCQFANFGTFYGWPNSSAALINWSDEAGRSSYDNVEFMGFGDATVSTGSSNLTGSRAFSFNNNTGETIWRNCQFGVDTLQRGAANFTMEFLGNGARLQMENCNFVSDLAAGGTGSSHIKIGTAGIDRWLNLVGCRFNSFNGGSTMAQALNVTLDCGGNVFLDQCSAYGAITAWQTAPTANVQMNMVAATTTGGLAHEVF
jgi:hypothetical protein